MPKLVIDGKTCDVAPGASVLDAARAHGIWIPTLCHNEHLSDYGACRLCLVEVIQDGQSRIAASCTLPVGEGKIEIRTNTERVRRLRQLAMELILASCPQVPAIQAMAARLGVRGGRLDEEEHNDCIRCGLCVRACEEVSRASAITFAGRGILRRVTTPFDEPNPDCILCGACVFYCPTGSRLLNLAELSGRTPRQLVSGFDAGLRRRAAIDQPFAQALPNVPAIDPAACLKLNRDACGICQKVCQPKAIGFDDSDREETVEVGAVIVAPGYQPFSPGQQPLRGYGRTPNVISSMEFERMLCASGPFGGHVMRPSDRRPVRRLAFIQCVGSRDRACGREYCSSVCCMYAVKEAVIAREHDKAIQPTIFYMDLRAHGKDFDRYVERAEKEYGVVFQRSRVARVEEGADGQVAVHIENEQGEFARELFDLVVLSVGLDPGADFPELARRLQVELDAHGFFQSSPLAPLDATRPGVYVCGAAAGPKDIPETVTQASGAAARAAVLLAGARGTLTRRKDYPAEREVGSEEPRIGVFVCHCGINIGSVVRVPSVVDYARTLPNVVYAGENVYTCSQDSQDKLRHIIHEYALNRVVVAACSPRTHEPLFQETLREAGLNAHLFEMANIRDQCSWIHSDAPEAATEKARDLLRMAVAKVRLAEPLKSIVLPVTQSALVIGGGPAGMTAALSMADQGFEVFLVEKAASPGGHLARIGHSLEGAEFAPFAADLVDRVRRHRRIRLFTRSVVESTTGFLGNYETAIRTTVGRGARRSTVRHGVVLLAAGAAESVPEGYGYGRDRRVVTLLDLERKMASPKFRPPSSVVMVQCVGSREDAHPYCSRVCCAAAVKHALEIKRRRPETEVAILYRDLRTYGAAETYYAQAREAGVQFLRYDAATPPRAVRRGGRLSVRLHDTLLDQDVELPADLLVLGARMDANPDNADLSTLFKVPRNADGFFLEAHMKLRPVDFATEGVFMAGTAHSPKNVSETIAQAEAAAARACTIISKTEFAAEPIVAAVNDDLCDGCGLCVPVCDYGALTIEVVTLDGVEKKIVRVNEGLCKGCGGCAATCPSGAMEQKGYKTQQLIAMVDAALE